MKLYTFVYFKYGLYNLVILLSSVLGDKMNIKKDFGLRIKELRNKKGMTQYELAEMVAIDPKHISHIETGRSFPKADLIEKFATAFGVDYTEFFKTEHLQDRKYLTEKINIIIKNATNEDLRKILKILMCLTN